MDQNDNVKSLITELQKAYKGNANPNKARKIEVSSATSVVSTIYERVRNTIDFKDEHFIRRYAIQRFLRVYLTSKSESDDTAELLLRDLLRGRYIQEENIEDWKIEETAKILSRYIKSKALINEKRISLDRHDVWDFLLCIASSEIEKIIDPSYKPEVFIKLMSKYILAALKGTNLDLSPEQERLHVFIACHKALVRSDVPVLRYHAYSILHPEFFEGCDEACLRGIIENLPETAAYVDDVIKSRTQEVLAIQVRKYAPPFKVLEGTLEQDIDHIQELLEDENKLRDRCDEYIVNYYNELSKKLNLRISRTLIYLIITKMVLALIIEVPVDTFFYNHVNYVTLAINAIFPVALFYLIARRIRIPGKENNERINGVISLVVYKDRLFTTDQEENLFRKRIVANFRSKSWVSYLYVVLYLLVYGVIAIILSKLQFNFASIALFFFFVSVLSFFAWNIRARSADLQMIPRKDNFIEAILNIIALPILKVGQKLSVQVSRFNFFTLIFDVILEAPFKIIVQSIEDLIDYLKNKHEEVVE